MPLRLYMDQDTISFLFDFFTYSDKIGTPTDAPETPLPDLDQLTETILFGNPIYPSIDFQRTLFSRNYRLSWANSYSILLFTYQFVL